MQRLLLAAIGAYQRYVSPHKGFCCAYAAHTGWRSCSTLGYRAVRRFGAASGLAIIRRRTALCGVVHRRHAATVLHAERGVCDIGCDAPCDGPDLASCDAPCDLRGGQLPRGLCDAVSCCDGCNACDWPSRRRKTGDDERYVYIPPRAGPRDGRDVGVRAMPD